MPVLKDLECTRCGAIQEELVRAALSLVRLKCFTCNRTTKHRSVCNGGTKRHLGYNKFDLLHHPEYFVSVDGLFAGHPDPAALNSNDELKGMRPITHHATGQKIQDMPRFSKEARDEKRAKRVHDRLRKLGRQKAFVSRATSAQGAR